MRALRTCCFAALAVLCACSAEDGGAAAVSGAPTTRARLRVVVELDDAGGTRVLADARFLRYRDLDPGTAEVLAGSEPRAHLELGRCAVTGSDDRLDRALASLPERAVLHYLDAGEIVVQAGGAGGSFAPRDRPALFPYVAGVEYAPLDLEEGPVVSGREEVHVTGYGGSEVGAFDASVTLPPPPAQLEADPSGQGDLEVTWEGRAERGGVIVSVRASGQEIRCHTEDDGRIVLAASILSTLPSDSTPLVSLERWRSVSLSAAGLEEGELEVAARAVVAAGAP